MKRYVTPRFMTGTNVRRIRLQLGVSQRELAEFINVSVPTVERLRFLVEQTVRMTGLERFGQYICDVMTIDAFFLNEDRHTHNIAVLMNDVGEYDYCPIFDNGAGLLSDTTMDYPLNKDVESLLGTVHAKTFCRDFDEQLDIAEQLYGQKLRFSFADTDILAALENASYDEAIKKRIVSILRNQRRKYQYLFTAHEAV